MDNELLLIDRIGVIKDTIEKYGEDKCYLSFSGGKDSTVLHYLIDIAMPGNKVKRVFANTGMDYKHIVEFVKEMARNDDRFIILKPKVPIKKMLENDGYPFKSKHHSEMVAIYQRNNESSSALKYRDGEYNFNSNKCPNILKYQFTNGYNKLKISDKCCYNVKEKPLREYEQENNMKVCIVGIMREEGGRRESAKCFVKYPKGMYHFHPLAVATKEWEDWLIEKYDIKLCELYYPPYNFDRTGCVGCPYNIKLQKYLETLGKLLPNERKRAEVIWKPVYEEYRRLGYRLKKHEQLAIDDFIKGDK